MRVLWIVNHPFPEAKALITGKQVSLIGSGGWLLGSAAAMSNQVSIDLYVASVTPLVKELTFLQGSCCTHIAIPLGKGNMRINREYDKYWKEISERLKPDIIHIHGTEFSHGLSYLLACGSNHVVISIQGLTSVYYYYYYYGLSSWDIIKNISFFDIYVGTLFKQKRKYKKRSIYEKQMIQLTNNIIGRTIWDHAHVWSLNPKAKYYYCNETLRSSFYEGDKWDYKQCQPHRIFASQASMPIKGFHQLLKALPIVLKFFPDTKVYVAGPDLTGLCIKRNRLAISGYGRYLRSLIKENNLLGVVEFVGPISEYEMKNQYLKANLFISASSIENSPNSLGEAQILGVPCLSSYVGGVENMIPNTNCGEMYRFEEVEVLAYKICELFKNSKTFDNSKMIEEAQNRHDANTNVNQTMLIYNEIIKGR